MSGWLTTATNVFRRKSDAPPQTYELRCGCGQIVCGQRTRAEQSTTCPACMTVLFVLPACVYPLPKVPPPKKPARAPRPSLDDDTLATGQKGTSHDRSDTSRSRRRSPSAAKRSAVAAEPAFHQRLRQAIEPAHLDRLRRKWLTPLRMVLLGIALVVVATVWWMGHLQALDRARDVLATVPRLADDALQEGDAPEAARQFAQLRDAVDLLGRDDSQSRRWRQLARETAAIADLAAAPLHDILHEAAEAADGTAGNAWSSVFRANYRGGWILIDAPVSREAAAAEAGSCSVDFPLVIGAERGQLIAELPALEPALDADGAERRIIFAAQLADCRLEPEPHPTWRIELSPETGFLWTGAETFRMLGMPTDDGSLEVLAAQARLLGIEP